MSGEKGRDKSYAESQYYRSGLQCRKYLQECVESVLCQTLSDIELILVDDGSTDSSPTLCDQYAAQDRRMKVIHKPNGRAASARNAGLRAASGEYVAFVDADDWISPDMYEKCCKPMRM